MEYEEDILNLVAGKSSGRKSKSSKKSSSKRKRQAAPDLSASDMELSSGDGVVAPSKRPLKKGRNGGRSDGEGGPPVYALEGKYADEAEREKVKNMSEFDREAFLADRLEESAKYFERAELRRMVQAKERQEGGKNSSDEEEEEEEEEEADDDRGKRRTTRTRQANGATKEKTSALDKYKKKRAAKGKKRNNDVSDSDDDGSSDLTALSEAEEDAYQGDTRDKKSKKGKGKKAAQEEDVAGPTDLREITVTRDKLVEMSRAPWFGEWCKHAWVRYLIGQDEHTRENKYRICRIEDFRTVSSAPYTIDGAPCNIWITLRHGDAVREFSMEAVSNSPFTDSEFGRLSATLHGLKIPFPTQKSFKETKAQLAKRTEYRKTAADVNAMLEMKRQARGGDLNRTVVKAKLLIQRDFAHSEGDAAQFATAKEDLEKLAPTDRPKGAETEAERMARVNERNRANNREEIRKAEGKNQEERRKLAAALKRGDLDVKIDASARLKPTTHLKLDRADASRSATPQTNANTQPVPTSVPRQKNKFEEMIASVEVDVDLDF